MVSVNSKVWRAETQAAIRVVVMMRRDKELLLANMGEFDESTSEELAFERDLRQLYIDF